MENNEIDLVAIQEQIEANVYAEYRAEFDKLEKQRKEHQDRTQGWTAIMWRIKEHYSGPLTLADNDHLDQFLERLDVIVRLGLDFEKLTEAIKTNELVKRQWDQMLMMMRLSGMDNSTSGPDNE